MARRRGELRASASAPVLPHDGGAYAHSERMERRVPPLALVPLDQLQQLQRRRRRATEEMEENRTRQVPRNADDRHHNNAAMQRKRKGEREKQAEEEEQQQQQQRLGERFLGMMALLARLRRMDLDESGASPGKAQRSVSAVRKSPKRGTAVTSSSSALEKLVAEKKRAERCVFAEGGADAVRAALALSPRKKPEPVVNAATKPLREHLTFEISVLLPTPMDTRQSALQSPIERKPKRTKQKRRRRRRRPTGAVVGTDGKRTWQTSHVTWVAHASADYAQARAAEGLAARSGSKLVAKFASLRGTASSSTDQRVKYLNATDNRCPPARRMGERRLDHKQREGRDGTGRVEEEKEKEEEPVEEAESEAAEEADPAFAVGEEEDDDDEDNDENGDEHDDADEEKEEEEEEEEEEREDDGEDADHIDALPELLPASSSIVKRPLAFSSSTSTTQRLRPVQTHQAAWISPELRTWLIHTGLFRTTNPHEVPH